MCVGYKTTWQRQSWQFDKFVNDCRLPAQSDQASGWIGLVLLSLSIVKTGLLIMKTNIKVQWRLWYTYLFYEAYFITECLNPLFILTVGLPTMVNVSISLCGRRMCCTLLGYNKRYIADLLGTMAPSFVRICYLHHHVKATDMMSCNVADRLPSNFSEELPARMSRQ
jgi:hypothetical protein